MDPVTLLVRMCHVEQYVASESADVRIVEMIGELGEYHFEDFMEVTLPRDVLEDVVSRLVDWESFRLPEFEAALVARSEKFGVNGFVVAPLDECVSSREFGFGNVNQVVLDLEGVERSFDMGAVHIFWRDGEKTLVIEKVAA